MSDLITDAMMEATDYEYRLGNAADGEGNAIKGKAHSGMVQSGKYLGERKLVLGRTLFHVVSNSLMLAVLLFQYNVTRSFFLHY
jgi:hypothetical protein